QDPCPRPQASPAPPHPASHPTRRSSDLHAGARPPSVAPAEPNSSSQSANRRAEPKNTITPTATAEKSARRFALWLLLLGSAGATDRKSTRLNSSHGSNSYAVFCLKKKKP